MRYSNQASSLAAAYPRHDSAVPTGLWSRMEKKDLQSIGVIKNHPDYQMDCESGRLTMFVNDCA
ncbi:MAG: hypothetical protein GX561_06010 [Lentisphaerae bacterium]|nr:hypothetical protein [Lentisphaerota bacterium]